MNIDRQRISAVTVLEDLDYTFFEGRWQGPPFSAALLADADALFGLLADQAERWPGGKAPGAKA